jgi:hypothetical protein
LFDAGFPHFDGNSTTLPSSSVQRHYPEAALNESTLSTNLLNFTSLVKAGSFVASDCHGGDGANANRNEVIRDIRNAGFRVDGLGKCMRSYGPEGITLPNMRNTGLNLVLKRQTIAKYMFNMAFENSIEQGYVTEKPFDALIAGTVVTHAPTTCCVSFAFCSLHLRLMSLCMNRPYQLLPQHVFTTQNIHY